MNKRFTIVSVFYFILTLISIRAQTATLEATFSLKELNGVYIPYQNGMPVPSFEKQNRQIIDLKGTWKKQRFASDDSISLIKRDEAGYTSLIAEAQDRYKPEYDDSGWENKAIPGVENTMYPFPKVPEYYEDGMWYRYKFNVPDSANGKFIKLNFYSVNYVADVWLNGNYLGYHEGGYTPFSFDVSSKLNFGNDNVLAVRVDNPEWGTRNDIVPFYEVDWFNYAGIIHDVYLEITDKINVLRADIVPKDVDGNIQTTIVLKNKNPENKNVSVKVEIYNADIDSLNIHSELASDLIGSPANVSGETETQITIPADSFNIWHTSIKVENPKLWFPNDPNLYVMKVSLLDGAKVLDEFYTQFGIRSIKRDGDKVLLNNQIVFLTGVARHEDHPLYGRSIPLDTIFSDLQKVKGINANYLRTAHYPNHLYTYLVADRLGIIIMEEIPVWWFDEALPWEIQNNQRHIHEQMFKEMVFKDYNRPSIMMWSTQNESREVPNRKIWIEHIESELDTKFPDGRLVTQSAAADRPGPEDESQQVCDIAGWTMYYGVFYGTSATGGTNNFLINAKIKQPAKPVIATEFGTWSGEDNSGLQNQVKIFNNTFSAFKNFAPISASGTYNSNGFLMGITWWCIFDWYSHGHPYGYQSMGLYSMDRKSLKEVGQVLKDTYLPYFSKGNIITGVEEKNKEKETLPSKFNLGQNYPNPFNPSTKITFTIPALARQCDLLYVSLKVYNILGKEVATLLSEKKAAGEYEVEFDASSLPSGLYIYELRAGEFSSSRKMVLIR